jgi:hypothetical protein
MVKISIRTTPEAARVTRRGLPSGAWYALVDAGHQSDGRTTRVEMLRADAARAARSVHKRVGSLRDAGAVVLAAELDYVLDELVLELAGRSPELVASKLRAAEQRAEGCA